MPPTGSIHGTSPDMQFHYLCTMGLLERITVNPDVCNGKPTIRGMRITVRTILEYIAAGDTAENILEAYPVLEADDIKAALAFAAEVSGHGLHSVKTA